MRVLQQLTGMIDGSPVDAVHAHIREAVAAIRGGGGPQFFECTTYRWRDHVGPGEDRYLGYREDRELDEWIARDELVRLSALLDEGERQSLEAAVEEEIRQAIAFAETSQFPNDAELFDHVYA